MNWENKNVLVTGAGGFIGSHLVEKLLELNSNVKVLLRYTSERNIGNLKYLNKENFDKLQIEYGNIEDQNFVNHMTKDIDIVLHLAALIGIPYSYNAPSSYISTNIKGTVNILEAAKLHNIEMTLTTSTSEVYGTAQFVPINESHPLVGQSPYSASKIAADKLVESYYLSFDLPVTIVRPFNTFGPRQSTRAVIPTIISQALYSDEIKLGDIDTTRDYVYVKDTANGFVKIAESPRFGLVTNLATKQEHSIKDIASKIIKLVNPNLKIIQEKHRFRPPKSEVRRLLGDPTEANKLGWYPKYKFDEGLKETIDWYQKYWEKSNYKLSKYVI